MLTASGGNTSKAIAHRRETAKILHEGTAQALREYFDSNAFEASPAVRAQERRYAAITALVGVLFRDTDRREKLLNQLRLHDPNESIAGEFLLNGQPLEADIKKRAQTIAQGTHVNADCIEVLLQVLTETKEASIDPRGKMDDQYYGIKGILYGGFSTMDNVLDAMHQCIEKDLIYLDSGFMSYATEVRQKIVKDILTVSFHRFQAVAGMKQNVSSSLLNSDMLSEWILLKRGDGQVVVTTKTLEVYLSESKQSSLFDRQEMRHKFGNTDGRYTQGCPIVILPLFLHAARAMIERYSQKTQ